MYFSNQRYQALRRTFQGKSLPLAFVDLDAFDANVAYVAAHVQDSGKRIRLGSKSIRCEPLMRRILSADQSYRGFLTFTVSETAFLAAKGHDDFIVAYPSVQTSDLELLIKMTQQGLRVAMMVDSYEHMAALSSAGLAAGVTLAACLEVDMAFRPLGQAVHLGLRRSPIRTAGQALELFEQVKVLDGVRIDCLMGYEGHIAGVNDAIPGQALKNFVMRALKKASVRELTRRRGQIVMALQAAGVEFKAVNGGGSGSLVSTLADPNVDEVTVGSGFYASGLFHHFAEVRYQPAAFFASQVVRRPSPGMIACQGGGYIASGPIEDTKAPTPVLPVGLKYLPLEGAGEVSTPLLIPDGAPGLDLGDPVFFQHAKAGELCERFDSLYLVQNGEIVDRVPTYRGQGGTFL